MILSSCYDYSLNDDCHCHYHCHYMQRIYVYFISPCLDLTCLVLCWVDKYYYCYYRHDVVWARLTLSYQIMSYLMFFNFISSADLISIPFHSIEFYSILVNFKLFWFDLIWLNSILLNLIYYIVQYNISYQWMICVFLSMSVCSFVRLSVCLFVYLYE